MEICGDWFEPSRPSKAWSSLKQAGGDELAQGPEFLCKPERTLLTNETFVLSASNPEVRKAVFSPSVNMHKEEDLGAERFQKFSSLTSLQWVVANLIVIVRVFKHRRDVKAERVIRTNNFIYIASTGECSGQGYSSVTSRKKKSLTHWVVYLNLVLRTSNRVIFYEIAAHKDITTIHDLIKIYSILSFLNQSWIPDPRSTIPDPRSSILHLSFPVNLKVLIIKIVLFLDQVINAFKR